MKKLQKSHCPEILFLPRRSQSSRNCIHRQQQFGEKRIGQLFVSRSFGGSPAFEQVDLQAVQLAEALLAGFDETVNVEVLLPERSCVSGHPSL